MDFILAVLYALERILDAGSDAQQASTDSRLAAFATNSLPPISIERYVRRIVRYGELTEEELTFALVYVDRLVWLYNLHVTPLNVHLLVLTAAMLASKFLTDQPFPNSYWARVGGIAVQQLNKLEITFFSMLAGELVVDSSTRDRYKGALATFYAHHKACEDSIATSVCGEGSAIGGGTAFEQVSRLL